MSRTTPPVDFSKLSPTETRQRIGELVELCLRRSGACVLVRRRTGEFTVVDPGVLDHVPEVDIAEALLRAWTDEEVLAYLKERTQRAKEPDHG